MSSVPNHAGAKRDPTGEQPIAHDGTGGNLWGRQGTIEAGQARVCDGSVAGRVFTWQAQPLQWAEGVILGVFPILPPSRASPRSFRGRGPFLPTCFNGDPSGEKAEPGARCRER